MIGFEYQKTVISDSRFTEFYKEVENDIDRLFPNFEIEMVEMSDVEILLLDNQVCGILIISEKGEEIHIELDYVVPKVRDLGVGQSYLAKKFVEFKDAGFSIVYASTGDQKQQDYLGSMDFQKSIKHLDLFERKLN